MRVPLRVSRNPNAPALSAFTHPGVPTGGAKEFSPAKVLAYPLSRIEGPGVVSGQYMLDQGPQMRTVFAPFIAPVQGGGVIAGQLTNQRLVDPYDDGSPYVAEDNNESDADY
jgi:hypothetical protein